MARPQSTLIREFLLKNLTGHEGDIASFAARELGVTRASINNYLRKLVEEGLLASTGATKARRIMMRAEKFTEVWLDFTEVNEIGQQFADEIFRVWAKAHPHVQLYKSNASQGVEMMIQHALANASEDDQLSLGLEPPTGK